MKLVIATNNPHKITEIKHAVGDKLEVVSLKEMGIEEEIPETNPTLEGNALQKAKYIRDKYQLACFADDTGLEIEALDGRPGVFSARYAGDNCSFQDNMDKVLAEMQGKENRKACFRTVVALVMGDEEYIFEGKVVGSIADKELGEKGFGYDPIFIPENNIRSFAQMSLEEKNAISHRSRAVKKFMQFIQEKYNS